VSLPFRNNKIRELFEAESDEVKEEIADLRARNVPEDPDTEDKQIDDGLSPEERQRVAKLKGYQV